MKKTFKNRILDKLFYHKYDWVTVSGKSLYDIENKCLELKGVKHGYSVYKCIGAFPFPNKVIMYRKKGYKPEQHYSVELNKQVAEYNAKTGSNINAETTNPWLLVTLLATSTIGLMFKNTVDNHDSFNNTPNT